MLRICIQSFVRTEWWMFVCVCVMCVQLRRCAPFAAILHIIQLFMEYASVFQSPCWIGFILCFCSPFQHEREREHFLFFIAERVNRPRFFSTMCSTERYTRHTHTQHLFASTSTVYTLIPSLHINLNEWVILSVYTTLNDCCVFTVYRFIARRMSVCQTCLTAKIYLWLEATELAQSFKTIPPVHSVFFFLYLLFLLFPNKT